MQNQLKLWNDSQDPIGQTDAPRPIHYLGSKLRLVPQILSALDAIDPAQGPTCDLFAGSGTVAAALASHRQVLSVDIQEYSRVLCSALLNPASVPENQISTLLHEAGNGDLADQLRTSLQPLLAYERTSIKRGMQGDLEALCQLLDMGSLYAFKNGPDAPATESEIIRPLGKAHRLLQECGLWNSPSSMITRYYGGVYFSYEQAIAIDCLLDEVSTLAEDRRDTFLAAALSAASDAVNTVGKQFAQPIRPRRSDGTPKPRLLQRVLRDRNLDVLELYADWIDTYLTRDTVGQHHFAIQADYRDFLDNYDGPLTAVYADPPYTRDHYSRFYHVLESMCLRDNPELSTTQSGGEERLSRGLYRNDRHQSPFCIKSQVDDAFRALFHKVAQRGAALVLSYSPDYGDKGGRPRLMSIDDLSEMAEQSFTQVSVQPVANVTHSKLNRTAVNSAVKGSAEEVLLLCSN